jgi:adenylate kinase family enzyme
LEQRLFLNAIRTHSDADLRVFFDIIDSDKSGTIDRVELETLMSSSKGFSKVSAEEISAIFGNQDSIPYEKFKSFLHSGNHLGLAQKLVTPYRVVFGVGGPGSGKGTYSDLLAKKYHHVKHVSCGELLRAEVKRGTDLGRKIAAKIAEGSLISASIVMALLDKSLMASGGKIVVLDGFPRSLENAKDFMDIYSHCEAILFFDCPEEVMIQRIIARGVSSGRSDDTEATARWRIKIYREQSTEPIAYLIREHNIKSYHIDTTRPIQENMEMLEKLPFFTRTDAAS